VTSNGESYARQSPVTDPGEGSSWYDGLPTDLAMLTAVVRNLVVHQDRVPPGSVDGARLAREPRVRDVATMVATLRELDARPATERRAPQNRIVGHCRTSTSRPAGSTASASTRWMSPATSCCSLVGPGRDGRTDSDRWRWYGSHPGDTGRAYAAGQLLRDVACLRRDEPGAFDSWAPDPLPPYLEDLDRLAAQTLQPEPQLRDLDPALLR
jgi:hypothetical protein